MYSQPSCENRIVNNLFFKNNAKPLAGINEENSSICFEKNHFGCCIQNGLEEDKGESREIC